VEGVLTVPGKRHANYILWPTFRCCRALHWLQSGSRTRACRQPGYCLPCAADRLYLPVLRALCSFCCYPALVTHASQARDVIMACMHGAVHIRRSSEPGAVQLSGGRSWRDRRCTASWTELRDLLKKPESDERRAFPAVRVRRHSKEQVKPSCERNVGVTWTHARGFSTSARTYLQKSEQRCQKFQLHY
jgi:hypothetical protein